MEAERIIKVKTIDTKIQLAFSAPNGDEFDGKFGDPPRPEFQEAFQAVKGPALEYLELPPSYGDTTSVSGVKFTWTDGVMGAVITLRKELQAVDAPLILNTPHAPEAPYSEGAGGALLPGELVEKLEAVIDEAKRYIRGERAQGDLFANSFAEDPSAPTGAGNNNPSFGGIQLYSEPEVDEMATELVTA